jgi:hypothetical protein
MTFFSRTLGTAFVCCLLAGPTFAQAPAPAPAAKTTPAPAAKTKAEKPRSAVSIDCSKQADAKGLHGKERHKFRSKCTRDAAKK